MNLKQIIVCNIVDYLFINLIKYYLYLVNTVINLLILFLK